MDEGASRSAIDEAADRLQAAADMRVACPPVRDLIGGAGTTAAYAVQRELTRRRVRAGGRVVGWKIGVTSQAAQELLGTDRPAFGALLHDMDFPDGALVPYDRLMQPRIEAEVAFVLGEDLAEGELGYHRVEAAVSHVVAALEVADSRIADWDIQLADTVADNASSGGFVLGLHRVGLAKLTPRDVTMRMVVSGHEDSTGSGAACLGDPLLAVQWLAREARDLGTPLLAGHVVLSGALGPSRPVEPGASATATITGLGSVSVRFSEPHEELRPAP